MAPKKKAVVVIHGIGNQRPMQTVKELVKSLAGENDIIYSAPNRVKNFYETRRSSISKKNTDFFELYWANIIQNPNRVSFLWWLFQLVFTKKPSERARNIILIVRYVILLIILGLFISFYLDYTISFDFIPRTILYTVIVPAIIYFILPLIEKTVVSSLGDALVYLTPSPEHISMRYDIRKHGKDLLKNLQNKKNFKGEDEYDEIIIIGHSLGSVIAFDLLTHLWYENMYALNPLNPKFSQVQTKKMNEFLIQYYKNRLPNSHLPFDFETFTKLQNEVFKELKCNESTWKISKFITMGSPLCHGSYVLAENENEFIERKRFREIPVCPPKLEVTNNSITQKIEKDYKRGILFCTEINDKKVEVISHSSPFASVQWTNVYFKNDQIGGNLQNAFGPGIKNVCLQPKGNWFKKNLPVHSHTDYWDSNQEDSLNILKQLVFEE